MTGLKMLVTIDVEEEGLFNNLYNVGNASVENVTKLSLLDPMFCKLEIHPTLLVSYQVVRRKRHHDFLMGIKNKWDGEIGAHLHHWNTPPIQQLPYPHPIPSKLIPRKLLKAKLESLLDALAVMGVEARSFRMGRFSMGEKMFSLLEQTDIQVDSSIVPTRKEYGGPEYLVAPLEPYFPDPKNLASRGDSSLLEVPVTVLPVIPGLNVLFEKMFNVWPVSSDAVAWASKYIGSLSVQPMAVGLGRMKTAVKLHLLRGGKTVVIYFHSSELMPGCSPQHPTQRHVEEFLTKIEKFFSWMRNDMGALSITLSDLRKSDEGIF